MKKDTNFWKGFSFVLIALVLFLTVADVSVSPRFMSSGNESEVAETAETAQTRQASQLRGGLVGEF